MRYNFQPELFISVGAKGCLFTLRETYLHETYVRGNGQWGGCVVNGEFQGEVRREVRSNHIVNLSADPDEAIRKAKDVAEVMGIALRTTRDRLADELNEIRRATADQIAEREAAAKARELAWEAEAKLQRDRDEQVIRAGFFPFGRFAGVAFEQAERGYIQWLMADPARFEDGTLLRMIADKLVADYPELAPPKFNDAHVGNIGDRLTLDVQVVKVAMINTDFGPVFFVTMATKEGACILAKGRFNANVGEVLKIKATVTKHDQYKDQNQTVVNRVKIIE